MKASKKILALPNIKQTCSVIVGELRFSEDLKKCIVLSVRHKKMKIHRKTGMKHMHVILVNKQIFIVDLPRTKFFLRYNKVSDICQINRRIK